MDEIHQPPHVDSDLALATLGQKFRLDHEGGFVHNYDRLIRLVQNSYVDKTLWWSELGKRAILARLELAENKMA